MVRGTMRLLNLILVLCLVLTGVGLGVARGTVVRADRIVLCTGHGVVVVDHPDGTGKAAWLCPDMALSLLAATPDAPPVPVLPSAATDLARPMPDLLLPGHRSLRPTARGPPGDAASFAETA